MKKILEYLVLFLLSLSSIVLIGFQLKLAGFIILGLGMLLLLFLNRDFKKYFILLFFSVFVIGITPISSDLSYKHVVIMFIGVATALCVPYLVSRFIYKEDLIKFTIFSFNKWTKKSVAYVLFAIIFTYLSFSIYFLLTHAYQNWHVQRDLFFLFKLLLGIFIVGAWDELMFIGTFFMVLKRFFSFRFANIAQAVIFSSFLYQIGFRSWGYGLIFLIALLHGATYKKIQSLSYLFIIHSIVDVILFLLLIQYSL